MTALPLILTYYALTTIIGGLFMSWHFTRLRRDAVAGAFSGFGAAAAGFGIPGLAALYYLTPAKKLGLVEEATEDMRDPEARFKFESNVVWGMLAFGFTWVLLIMLALDASSSRFLVVVAGGVYRGMLVFLVAAGLSIVFGLMDVLNLAQGAMFMVGAYVAFEIYGTLGDLPLGLAFLLGLIGAAIVGALIGILTERFLIRPTYSRPFFQIVLTFGLALTLRELIVGEYGTESVGRIDLSESELLSGLISGTSIQNYWIFMIIIGVTLMIGVQYLLQNTRLGIIIRAGVQDSEMVEALGVNVRLVFTGVFALGASIAALGGAVAGGFLPLSPAMGDIFLLEAIAAVIVGGLGSFSGTAIAAIVLGITRGVAEYFFFDAGALGLPTVLVILLIVLLIKPTGLFGRAH